MNPAPPVTRTRLATILLPELGSEGVPGQASLIRVLQVELLIHDVQENSSFGAALVAVSDSGRDVKQSRLLAGEHERAPDTLRRGPGPTVHEPHQELASHHA